MQAEISRAAAAIAQGLSMIERFKLAQAINEVDNLNDIPEKYREQISVLIKKKKLDISLVSMTS